MPTQAKASKSMFKIGNVIVYTNIGLCEVRDFGEIEYAGQKSKTVILHRYGQNTAPIIVPEARWTTDNFILPPGLPEIKKALKILSNSTRSSQLLSWQHVRKKALDAQSVHSVSNLAKALHILLTSEVQNWADPTQPKKTLKDPHDIIPGISTSKRFEIIKIVETLTGYLAYRCGLDEAQAINLIYSAAFYPNHLKTVTLMDSANNRRLRRKKAKKRNKAPIISIRAPQLPPALAGNIRPPRSKLNSPRDSSNNAASPMLASSSGKKRYYSPNPLPQNQDILTNFRSKVNTTGITNNLLHFAAECLTDPDDFTLFVYAFLAKQKDKLPISELSRRYNLSPQKIEEKCRNLEIIVKKSYHDKGYKQEINLTFAREPGAKRARVCSASVKRYRPKEINAEAHRELKNMLPTTGGSVSAFNFASAQIDNPIDFMIAARLWLLKRQERFSDKDIMGALRLTDRKMDHERYKQRVMNIHRTLISAAEHTSSNSLKSVNFSVLGQKLG